MWRRRGRGILVIGPELAGRLVVFTLNLRGSIPLSLRIAPRNSGSKHPLRYGASYVIAVERFIYTHRIRRVLTSGPTGMDSPYNI